MILALKPLVNAHPQASEKPIMQDLISTARGLGNDPATQTQAVARLMLQATVEFLFKRDGHGGHPGDRTPCCPAPCSMMQTTSSTSEKSASAAKVTAAARSAVAGGENFAMPGAGNRRENERFADTDARTRRREKPKPGWTTSRAGLGRLKCYSETAVVVLVLLSWWFVAVKGRKRTFASTRPRRWVAIGLKSPARGRRSRNAWCQHC